VLSYKPLNSGSLNPLFLYFAIARGKSRPQKLLFDIYRQVRYSFLEPKREEKSFLAVAFRNENEAIILIDEY
jgi:hypothetical protein